MLITLGKALRKNLRPKWGRAWSENTHKNMDTAQLSGVRGHHLSLGNAIGCDGVKNGSVEEAVSYLSELNQLLLFWTHPDVSERTKALLSPSPTVTAGGGSGTARWNVSLIGIPEGRGDFDAPVCRAPAKAKCVGALESWPLQHAGSLPLQACKFSTNECLFFHNTWLQLEGGRHHHHRRHCCCVCNWEDEEEEKKTKKTGDSQ